MSGRPPLVARGAPIAERLAALTNRSGGPEACWPWLRGFDQDGYGKMQLEGRTVRPHCVALEIELGRVITRHVLHSCDNPPCCNPKHLREGTQLDNRRDAVERGRTARGERHGSRTRPDRTPRGEKHSQSKISDVVRVAIRWLRSIGMQPRDIARATGAPRRIVYNVARGIS